MKVIRVMLAEHEARTRTDIAEYLGSQSDISLTGTARDGLEALRLIGEEAPDVLVTGLVLPRLDGLGLLERISALDKQPRTIVLSNLQSDLIVQQAMEWGASYYMCKPCDYRLLCERVRLCHYGGNPQAECEAAPRGIEEALRAQGMPAMLRGYAFLLSAIRLAVERGSVQGRVTKELYPSVARMHQTSPENVEHAIRHAISVVWDKRREGDSPFAQALRKPTNGEYIASMARQARQYSLS